MRFCSARIFYGSGGGGGGGITALGLAVPAAFAVTGSPVGPGPGTITLGYGTRLLPDSGGVGSMDFQNRNLLDSAAQAAVDFQNRNLITSTNKILLNWNVGTFFDTFGNITGSWKNCFLSDGLVGPSKLALDWANRRLYDATGLTIAVEWGNRLLKNAAGDRVADWSTLKLYDAGGGVCFDWHNRVVTNGAGVDVLSFYFAAPATLTAADGTATSSADSAVIDNIRTRLGELETLLQAYGICL